jgi:predicted protein tyrosine phosphatase
VGAATALLRCAVFHLLSYAVYTSPEARYVLGGITDSLGRSGGSVFCNFIGAAKVVRFRAARSTDVRRLLPDMDSCKIQIEVASRPEASKILSSPNECREVSFLVSIGAPEDELPEGYSNVSRKLRLLFGDTQTAEDGPTESDVRCLIELAHGLKGSAGKVLIHCEAGVSRSTAAALIMYTCLLGPVSEREAMESVLGQRPIARPNRRMVEIADHLLGRGGRLVEVLDSDGSQHKPAESER